MSTQSMLCPKCRKLISSDEKNCPHCGLSSPGSKWKTSATNILILNEDSILRYIIYLNVFMFIVSLLINPSAINMSANPFSLLSPSSNSLLILGATGSYPIDQYGRWWTLLSANYLHGGILHILFNMMALKQLAPFVVREFGVNKMVIIYTLGGVFGFLVSYFAGVTFTIGASAAVCSLIGAILYYGKSRGGNYGEAISKEVYGWLFSLALIGLVLPGINNWGHGGGLVGGILIAWLVGYKERSKKSFIISIISAGTILLTLAILLWAIAWTIYYTVSAS